MPLLQVALLGQVLHQELFYERSQRAMVVSSSLFGGILYGVRDTYRNR